MKKHIDYYLFFTVAALLSFGTLFLATLSATASLRAFGTTNYYLFHQLGSIAIGLVLGFIAFKTPPHILKKIAPYLVLANLMVMAVVFIPVIGPKLWGAKRWIDIGFINLQPSEFLKITAILYLAAWISSRLSENSASGWVSRAKKGYYNLIYVFVPFLVFLGLVSVILILQPDISTLGIIGLTLVFMYFSTKTPFWHTIVIMLGGLGALLLLIKFEPYRLNRWLIFMHPEKDPLGMGFQIKQSLIAIGSGGFFGKGWGMSTQKFGYLPQAMTDSAFAVLGEETGIIGCTILVVLFLFFLWFGLKIARSSNDKFSKFTAIGITCWITIQAFVNIGAAVGIIPLGGIPLPFFSYGGSHITSELLAMGILLNISKA